MKPKTASENVIIEEAAQEGSQSDSEAEDSPDESAREVNFSGTHIVKTVRYTDKEVLSAVDKMKVAKGAGSMQVLYGTVGSETIPARTPD